MTHRSNNIKGLVVGIDASRNRSGGAIAHLKGILEHFDPNIGIQEVHVWASESLLRCLPECSWLVKHRHAYIEKSLPHQLWWQARLLRKEAVRAGCNVLFATDASTLCNFKPLVVLSQDLLSYEPGVRQTYRWGKARLRLEVIKLIQNQAFRKAAGVLFLTQYARELVQTYSGTLDNTMIVPHGVDEPFRNSTSISPIQWAKVMQIRCLYVSNIDLYKHQWNVVKAIRILRDLGYPVTLTLAGGGDGVLRSRLSRTIKECGVSDWVTQLDFIAHSDLPAQLDQADIYIFASSCENLPVTLLEGMVKGLPIACSNRGPMPEVLGNAGEYFDPFEPQSIADAIIRLISDPKRSQQLAELARERASNYTWSECSSRTFSFIHESYFRQKIEKV